MKKRNIAILLVVLALLVCVTIVGTRHHSTTYTTPPWFGVIANLMLIQQAQQMYITYFDTYGTVEQLAAARFIDKDFASAFSSKLPVEGYYFEETIGEDRSWRCVARPADWGSVQNPGSKMEWRAKYNFMTSEDGIIYYNETENGTEFTKNYQQLLPFEVPPGQIPYPVCGEGIYVVG